MINTREKISVGKPIEIHKQVDKIIQYIENHSEEFNVYFDRLSECRLREDSRKLKRSIKIPKIFKERI